MTEELQKCPFCGMFPEVRKYDDEQGSLFAVKCTNLDCFINPITDAFGMVKTAISRWNRRA